MATDGAEALLDAARAEGCAVTPDTRAAVMAAAGLDAAAMDRTLAALARAGFVQAASPEVTVLTPTACADAVPRADFALVVTAAREEGCRLGRSQALAALAPIGAGAAALDRVEAELWGRGEGWTEDGVLHLGRGLCRGLPGSPAMIARREAEVAGWVEGRLRAAPGCSLTRADLALAGIGAGVSPSDFDRALASLRARDLLAGAGTEFRLASASCP